MKKLFFLLLFFSVSAYSMQRMLCCCKSKKNNQVRHTKARKQWTQKNKRADMLETVLGVHAHQTDYDHLTPGQKAYLAKLTLAMHYALRCQEMVQTLEDDVKQHAIPEPFRTPLLERAALMNQAKRDYEATRST